MVLSLGNVDEGTSLHRGSRPNPRLRIGVCCCCCCCCCNTVVAAVTVEDVEHVDGDIKTDADAEEYKLERIASAPLAGSDLDS